MQGARKVQSDGWSLQFTGLLSDQPIFFIEHSFLNQKGQGLGSSQTGDPRSQPAKQVMHGLYDGYKIAKVHILWLGPGLYSWGTSLQLEGHNQTKASDQDGSIPIM